MHKALFAVLVITILAGCNHEVKKDKPTHQPDIKTGEVMEEKEVSEETTEMEYKTFTSEELGFSVDVPNDWKMSDGGHDKEDVIFILFEKNEIERVSFLPKGGFDSDRFSDASVVRNTTIGGKKARIISYEPNDSENGISIIIFEEFPTAWNDKNRIVYEYPNEEYFDTLLNTFRFN